MPVEWAYILMCDKIHDKGQLFQYLKYEWTVSDVYDFMEVLDMFQYFDKKEMDRHNTNNNKFSGDFVPY